MIFEKIKGKVVTIVPNVPHSSGAEFKGKIVRHCLGSYIVVEQGKLWKIIPWTSIKEIITEKPSSEANQSGEVK